MSNIDPTIPIACPRCGLRSLVVRVPGDGDAAEVVSKCSECELIEERDAMAAKLAALRSVAKTFIEAMTTCRTCECTLLGPDGDWLHCYTCSSPDEDKMGDKGIPRVSTAFKALCAEVDAK